MSEVTKVTYCADCANQGIDLNGRPCHCRVNVKSFYDRVDCLAIPEQYRNIPFNRNLIPNDISDAYGRYLEKTFEDIVMQKLRHCNIALCSPVNHGKTIWAYSILENLFKLGVPVFPIFDILEIKRILLDMDFNRQQFYEVDKPELLITVPYLFCKVPRIPTWEVYDMIGVLIDRRVRRDNSTILLYEGSWNDLVFGDKKGLLTGLIGDGTYGTLNVQSYSAKAVEPLPQVQFKPNLG